MYQTTTGTLHVFLQSTTIAKTILLHLWSPKVINHARLSDESESMDFTDLEKFTSFYWYLCDALHELLSFWNILLRCVTTNALSIQWSAFPQRSSLGNDCKICHMHRFVNIKKYPFFSEMILSLFRATCTQCRRDSIDLKDASGLTLSTICDFVCHCLKKSFHTSAHVLLKQSGMSVLMNRLYFSFSSLQIPSQIK